MLNGFIAPGCGAEMHRGGTEGRGGSWLLGYYVLGWGYSCLDFFVLGEGNWDFLGLEVLGYLVIRFYVLGSRLGDFVLCTFYFCLFTFALILLPFHFSLSRDSEILMVFLCKQPSKIKT